MARIIPEHRLSAPAARRTARPRRRWLRRLLLLALLPWLLSVAGVAALRVVDPPGSMFMLAHRLGGGDVDQRWRDWDALSPQLPVALVAAEDQLFPTHSGFDVQAIRAALGEDRGQVRGASTISQQVAKNLFLWSGRSWLRKGMEAWFTLLIESLWPKQRTLEVYANIAEFGEGIYGAEAAAQRFFGKPASALGAAESARLAAVLPNPKRYSAAEPSAYVRRRQAWIEQQVRQLGGPDYLQACCR